MTTGDLIRQWYDNARSYKEMVTKKAGLEQGAGTSYRPEVDIEALDEEAERIIFAEERVPELQEVINNIRSATP